MGERSHCYRYEANYLSGNCLLSESWKSVSGSMMCTLYRGKCIYIRVDRPPLHSDSGARQRVWVSGVSEKCSETNDKSLEAKNGSRLQAAQALARHFNLQFKSFSINVDRFKYINGGYPQCIHRDDSII